MQPNHYPSICDLKVMYVVLLTTDYCLTNRGVDHGGVGGPDPLEICRRSEYVLTP